MKLSFARVALIILLAGCSASHPASQTSVLPDAPGVASQGVDPFKFSSKNVIHKYPLPSSSFPFNMATGPDKNIWFTDQGLVGKITPAGVVTEYEPPSGLFADDIAAGTKGTLWFTEGATGKIGRINAYTGHIKEFPAPSRGVVGIGKGPDGNMWFTDWFTDSVGKITPTGTVTEYALPTSNEEPTDIVTGPDGNMWYASTHGHVGRVTTSGTVTEFSGPDVGLAAIAAGPNGKLYATEANGIFEITTSGVITVFPSSVSYEDIILGPGKQMWISGDRQIYLRKFNPRTHVLSPPLALDPPNFLGGLTLGSDHDVWIADRSGHSILVYEERVTIIGIRLNGELSFTDPNYGFELGYAVGHESTQTQTISLRMGESVKFRNVDTEPHSAAFLGNATSNNAPWPGLFNGSTTKSPAGTAIGTTGWATGSLNPDTTSPIYETGLPGFYMIGCQYHYNTNEMRTVVVVH